MNKKNNQYCDYIRDSFKLYNEMKKENGSSIYAEDVMKFKSKFQNCELSFLNDKCPNVCPYLVYDKYSDKICQTEKEQEKYLEDRLQLDKKENNLPLVGAEGELEYVHDHFLLKSFIRLFI